MEFAPTTYQGDEGEMVDIIVVVVGSSEISFSVQFSTQDQTALGL